MATVEAYDHNGWVDIRFNRAEQRNAMSNELADAFVEALGSAEIGASGCVLTANGPVFCAGADLKAGVSLAADRPSSRMISALLDTPLFVVAAVQGGVYGAGVSLLAACPVVLATGAASVGFPEVKQGFFPVGVAPYVDRGTPSRRLVDLGMNGSSMDADEALRSDLFTEIVGSDRLRGRCEEWMALVAANPKAAKQAKEYWTSPLKSDGFRRRIEALEALLEIRVPTGASQV
jgi:enoyl-CoA hydratase/carnithine racemase